MSGRILERLLEEDNMSRSIIDIIDTVSDSGILKPNQYSINITIPAQWTMVGDLDSSYKELKQTIVRANRVTLPAKTLSTTPIQTAFKNEIQAPTGYENFEPLAVSFILSTDLRERKFFLTWFSNIIDWKNDRDVMFLDNIVGKLEISVYNDNQRATTSAVYAFDGVYPTSVGDLELSYDETDTYATVTVTFAYSKWYERGGYEDIQGNNQQPETSSRSNRNGVQ